MKCSWDRNRIHKLLEILKKEYIIDLESFIAWKLSLQKFSKFEILVGIILSQNTSDKNAIKAFNTLKKFVGEITPERIIEYDIETISELIKAAGMHRRRAKILIDLAKKFVEDKDFLDRISELDPEDMRKLLMQLPGIGAKTADVFILMVFKKPTFPVDTHINRVLKRLGIVDINAGYEDIRHKILTLLGKDVKPLIELHLLLIQHGRNTCKARAPRCSICKLYDLCCRIGV